MKSIILYFQFFTQIPIPIPVDEPMEKMKTGVKYFSVFGLLVGLIEALFFFGAAQLVSFNIAWIIVLFVDLVLTGGFHLDAISDMADGLFSSRKKERMLEIMKDSRVGSNGVLILIFYYLMLLVPFFEMSSDLTMKTALYIVVAMNMVGKMGISLMFYNMTYSGSNPQGLGTTFVGVKPINILIAQLVGLMTLYLMFGIKILIVYGIVFLFILLYRKMVYRKIEGLNGDTLGAASPLSQMIFMLFVSMVI
ncbi:adenosylcobinamide-GDP ribazoletransferase [Vagococcus carniphilus]|uniref:Adenosylcobinamide-GDP ribazoletransferase n=1 Tax=Vagococcus carniphilus TaxID=218144 RepID=A0A430B6X8_9ENTE|nr:adenosylcobinamide-GDP ribazoletransferase [Vagococcus carniphilus]MDT2830519.1 adenosylcobinamide-GDP ribazoletransferase [Vagococcus carniphilus]MDT2854736.1 adenosylcobinamide-GDP ribazoletransferase [Vagococcus carniphilus]QNN72471.1 adenosylcobinamide-GDP ribazoletransferase [Vagococcus carniphilus]RSU16082.1 adenosylcobinamide-GDP ribazoletransferase [Vagococcus carniphilus]